MAESFFDFRARASKPSGVETQADRLARAISVAELTGKIDSAIKTGVPASVLVRGEISNLNIHRASGHIYFTLKDDRSTIDCVMFRSDALKMGQPPRDGDEVLASGSVRVYVQRGRYQLYVTKLTPLGQGALEAKFRQLKEKLEKEGLFHVEHKKRLPRYPQRIALVTSRQAAGLQDMLKVFSAYPYLSVKLFDVPVQGSGSAEKIAKMLEKINQGEKADLVIVARGGGSLEDLWEFNEEKVARAIFASDIPVLTGIGHEVDVSIADLVADYHAHTPTEAAQVAVANWKLAAALIANASAGLLRSLNRSISSSRQRIVSIQRHEFFRRPADRINRFREMLDGRESQLRAALGKLSSRARQRLGGVESRLASQHPMSRLALARQKLLSIAHLLSHTNRSGFKTRHQAVEHLARQLSALNPTGVLARGYSITLSKKTGSIVRSSSDITPGEVLLTRFADGDVESVARDPAQPELF